MSFEMTHIIHPKMKSIQMMKILPRKKKEKSIFFIVEEMCLHEHYTTRTTTKSEKRTQI
jgi:hypothetical protein